MNPIAVHVASGDAFFTGAFLVAIGIGAWCAKRNWMRSIAGMVVISGCVMISISSSGMPIPLVVSFFASLAIATLTARIGRDPKPWVCLTIASFLSIVTIQSLYLIPKAIPACGSRRLLVIGDSISAGMNEPEEEKWPSMLAQHHDLMVDNLSRPGATSASIQSQLHRIPQEPCVVLVEIGGNDVFAARSVSDFRKDLRSILQSVSTPGKILMMMELPLPPFHDRFNRVQKELASEFHVTLIPKRNFLSVIASDQATSDSLHLTRTGHQNMAAMLWRFLGTAFDRN